MPRRPSRHEGCGPARGRNAGYTLPGVTGRRGAPAGSSHRVVALPHSSGWPKGQRCRRCAPGAVLSLGPPSPAGGDASMGPMFETFESRWMFCVGVPGGAGEAVEAHVESVAAVRVDLAARREALKDLAAEHRQTLRDLIDARRIAMRQIIDAIHEARGDAAARADLKAQLVTLRAEFKADLAEARASLKAVMEGARTEIKEVTGQFREAAAQLVSDVRALKSDMTHTPAEHREALRELVAELK